MFKIRRLITTAAFALCAALPSVAMAYDVMFIGPQLAVSSNPSRIENARDAFRNAASNPRIQVGTLNNLSSLNEANNYGQLDGNGVVVVMATNQDATAGM